MLRVEWFFTELVKSTKVSDAHAQIHRLWLRKQLKQSYSLRDSPVDTLWRQSDEDRGFKKLTKPIFFDILWIRSSIFFLLSPFDPCNLWMVPFECNRAGKHAILFAPMVPSQLLGLWQLRNRLSSFEDGRVESPKSNRESPVTKWKR